MKNDVIKNTSIPIYTLKQLEKTNNVLIARKYVVQYGEKELLKIFKNHGYDLKLNIVYYSKSTSKYPKDATYVLEQK